MNKEGLKSVVASFGYNRYIQNVVVNYYLIHVKNHYLHKDLNRSDIVDSKYYFNLLKSKKNILKNVIPELKKSKYNG